MNDMEILSEIRQIEASMPRLKACARQAATDYKAACLPLKPARDALKVAKAAVKAAQARRDELIKMGG